MGLEDQQYSKEDLLDLVVLEDLEDLRYLKEHLLGLVVLVGLEDLLR